LGTLKSLEEAKTGACSAKKLSGNVGEVRRTARRAPVAKVPGHWLLARLGKRVLRPGGLELTRKLLGQWAISQNDRVIDFAPGAAGLNVVASNTSPMPLLDPRRLITDDRFGRSLRFWVNIAFNTAARRRVLSMRRVVRK
jgi:hypothetical protein